MRSSLYWIDLPVKGRLAIMARPRAGDWLDDEIAAWQVQGIDIVLSLLEPSEIVELDLRREPELCRQHGIEFVSFAIPDRGVPSSLRETAVLVRTLSAGIAEGKAVAVHCRAGIGRSSLIAACTLVTSGVSAATALEAISRARGLSVPDTDGQRDWIMAFRDTLT